MRRVTQSRRAATRLVNDVRRAGGLVLLIEDRLELLNARAVPFDLKFRLYELEPFVSAALRELGAAAQ